MNDFNRFNKVSGIYWLKKGLSDLKIKIKLKPQDGIISLPKFEDYSKGSNALNLENTTEEYTFKWQEKVFSCWEVQRYTDHHNCITETELNYHEQINDIDYKPGKIFTYIHEDYYLPLPLDCKKKKDGILKLDSYMEQLSLNDPIARVFGGETISTTHLFKSEENLDVDQEEWIAMHVVYDSSDYNEDKHLIFKQEVTLLSLYHNISQNYLIITPDVNNLELNPYCVETLSGVLLGYQYAVEVEFNDVESGEELVLLLKKLHKRWERKQKHLLNFYMPPLGKKQYYISLEILTATGFDMDNLYIEFDIKVPEELECKDILQGRTHISEAATVDNIEEWSFGHVIEFSLEMDSGTEATPLKFFMEAISTDWWGRHRTEGYCYLPLPLEPGCFTQELTCRRPEEINSVEAKSRRFFLGGCHLIKDLNVLVEPQTKDANFTYITTGSIKVRWNIISQTHIGNMGTTLVAPVSGGASTASALLRGAEAALHKYKQARARLAAATKQIGDVHGEGDG
ncbi:Meckel syndrome, type 1 [Anticarsia gemmatalis]|uniref:Meckel syndrome, type 1 n=1 Tax=Anticarsia gemmatalis TaxID=129554 RepID=UPI003F767C50